MGKVTLNLTDIALSSLKNEEVFFTLLSERLDICREALMCRYYAILGTSCNTVPVMWQYGGISKLSKNDKIDKVLKEKGYLSFSYVGLVETIKYLLDEDITSKNGKNLALKIIKYIKNIIMKWNSELGITFNIVEAKDNVLNYFPKLDKEKFSIIKDVTDKDFYSALNHLDKEKMEDDVRMDLEKMFNSIIPSFIRIKKVDNLDSFITMIYDNNLSILYRGEK